MGGTRLNGIIVFYINFFPENGQDAETTINLVRNQNKALEERVKESGYDLMFVPTTKEASRVEKIDFDQPFPRYVKNNVDPISKDEDSK